MCDCVICVCVVRVAECVWYVSVAVCGVSLCVRPSVYVLPCVVFEWKWALTNQNRHSPGPQWVLEDPDVKPLLARLW